MFMKVLLLSVAMLFPFTLVASAANDKVISLAVPSPEESTFYRFLELYYNDLFNRIGYKAQLVYMPSARARINGELGKIDGQAGRSIEYQEITNHQVRVPVNILTVTYSVYSRTSEPPIDLVGWESFKRVNKKVEYRRGSTTPELMLTELVPDNLLSTVTSTAQGLLKLQAGRSDLFVGAEQIVESLLDSSDFSNIVRVVRLSNKDVYLYLHESHSNLVTSLAKEIRNLESEGKVEKYLTESVSLSASKCPEESNDCY